MSNTNQNQSPSLKPDLEIEVFGNPLTKENSEGIARLIKQAPSNRDNEFFQNWKVEFISDGFQCERLINLK